MQQTNTASQARRPKAPAIPALMPLPSPNGNRAIFWAVNVLNDDACVQALCAVQKPLYNQNGNGNYTKRIAMVAALAHAEKEAREAFEECRNAGGLLFAWRGSRALVQALPSSLRGAA
ncbi:MAG: hypothetical protein WBK26_05175 [Burkholderiaceae bacterium]